MANYVINLLPHTLLLRGGYVEIKSGQVREVFDAETRLGTYDDAIAQGLVKLVTSDTPPEPIVVSQEVVKAMPSKAAKVTQLGQGVDTGSLDEAGLKKYLEAQQVPQRDSAAAETAEVVTEENLDPQEALPAPAVKSGRKAATK